MRQYLGISALSNSQIEKLQESLSLAQPGVKKISAEYIHFAETLKPLSAKNEDKLKKLLTYGNPYEGDRSGIKVLTVPRPGTISPWSSKATNIAQNSGLKDIKRLERGIIYYVEVPKDTDIGLVKTMLYDRMTETILKDEDEAALLFKSLEPKPCAVIDISKGGIRALERANLKLGLALNDEEINYLFDEYTKAGRNPTDAELVMFGQINSEHCRHKIFNADWVIDGKKQHKSLFKMIKNTYEKNNEGVISAYSDNAAILQGPRVDKFYPDSKTGSYKNHPSDANLVIKAETHNHPTAIAPDPGAATGVGGEIRDEAATGQGAKSKMGFSGYSVSNLELPDFRQPWENPYGKPERISSALDIMLKAPIGAAGFANEFGRPNLAGYFRTFQQKHNDEIWGYHKPLMIAGGLGNIDTRQAEKSKLEADDILIVLGGPSMLIGLGGGASSSMQSGQSEEELDFASVQRANPEMQRRAQEVISTCASMNEGNPIKSIHDIGAGGLSNAVPEIVQDNNLGAEINLRDIPNAEPGLSPMEIWCNEAQERFVLAIDNADLNKFSQICAREKCPFAVIGKATKNRDLIINDSHFNNQPVNISMSTLFGSPPKLTKTIIGSDKKQYKETGFGSIQIDSAIENVLRVPSVASKKFLITIGDRTVGGMSVRDPMVGPWQVPVSDVAVTSNSFRSESGEAVSVGERSPIAVLDAPASARMAVSEALTNIAAAQIKDISDVKLSANWMAASGYAQEDRKLFDAVMAVGEELCPQLGITIPVGKDSLSMRTVWKDSDGDKAVTSPVSLIISAFAPVSNTVSTMTPQLHTDRETRLIYIDLAKGKNRLGASALGHAYGISGKEAPDLEDAKILKDFFKVIQELNSKQLISAYHDRSDGGLITTLLEMAFSSRCGLELDLSPLKDEPLRILFNEELGAVIEVDQKNVELVSSLLEKANQDFYELGGPTSSQTISITQNGKNIYQNSRAQLESWWSETSYHIQKLRDNKKMANEEFKLILKDDDPGISPKLTFDNNKFTTFPSRPKIAVLREQGVNGQVEMAAAFWEAGFDPVDVHMSDLTNKKVSINDFRGLVSSGGFSYGDVLGAGGGWAKSILFSDHLKDEFTRFFARKDTFSLGVCNGCQMLSQLKEMIPGAGHWPKFLRNDSEQFEARLVSVKVNETPSIFFKGMEGSILPVPTAHGEGKAVFDNEAQMKKAIADNLIPLQYADNSGNPTMQYPYNPNGSVSGITALTSKDGRSTIIMPHPERVFLARQLSWHPKEWNGFSPWIKIFRNAREWIN